MTEPHTELVTCPRCEGAGTWATVDHGGPCGRCAGTGRAQDLTAAGVDAWRALGLGPRVFWCLVRAGIPVAAAAAMPDDDLRGYRNFGVGALRELRAVLPYRPTTRVVDLADAPWRVIA